MAKITVTELSKMVEDLSKDQEIILEAIKHINKNLEELQDNVVYLDDVKMNKFGAIKRYLGDNYE